MERIAVLSCGRKAGRCTGADCISRIKAEGGELSGFFHCTGCLEPEEWRELLQKRLDRLAELEVTQVYLSACVTGTRSACPRKDTILEELHQRNLTVTGG